MASEERPPVWIWDRDGVETGGPCPNQSCGTPLLLPEGGWVVCPRCDGNRDDSKAQHPAGKAKTREHLRGGGRVHLAKKPPQEPKPEQGNQ